MFKKFKSFFQNIVQYYNKIVYSDLYIYDYFIGFNHYLIIEIKNKNMKFSLNKILKKVMLSEANIIWFYDYFDFEINGYDFLNEVNESYIIIIG